MGLYRCRPKGEKSEGSAGHVLQHFVLGWTVGTSATHSKS